MSYSKFTLTKLEEELHIITARATLFGKGSIQPIAPSEMLLGLLADAQDAPLATEIAIVAGIIYPIFNELRHRNKNRLTLFSGYSLNVDASKKLTGACDFLFTMLPDLIEVRAPIFCLVEAKNGIIENGLGQCGAEMYAAQLFNARMGYELPAVFGCVNNGSDWVFMRLEGMRLVVDKNIYRLSDVAMILGVLQYIIDFYEPYRIAKLKEA